MSHWDVGTTSGNLPPTVPTSFVTQNGTAVPLANVLIINADDSTENNNNGIVSKGGVAGTGTANEVDIIITNRVQGSGTTVGATTSDLFTLPLGAVAGTYLFEVRVVAYNASTPASAGFSTYTTFRTNGITATLIDDTDAVVHQEASLSLIDTNMVANGNNAIFRVTGQAGLTVDWNCVGLYTFVS